MRFYCVSICNMQVTLYHFMHMCYVKNLIYLNHLTDSYCGGSFIYLNLCIIYSNSVHGLHKWRSIVFIFTAYRGPVSLLIPWFLYYFCLSCSTVLYLQHRNMLCLYFQYTDPPVSLHGQLLWREFFNTVGSATPNFHKMEGNPVCRQIPWDTNDKYLEAWRNVSVKTFNWNF